MKKTKIIIYGNNDPSITKLEEYLDDLIIRVLGEGGVESAIDLQSNPQSIADVIGLDNKEDPEGYTLAIFLMIAPVKEIQIALERGLKVLLLLVPVEEIVKGRVIKGNTKDLTDKETLESDFLFAVKKAA